MNETARTGAFVVVAAIALVIAYFARPAAPEREAFDDSGERFFQEFDPLDARSMEIVSWDDETASVQAFKVAQVDGVWSIPSHEDYPADAEEQLVSAAASVMDLVKGPKVSDRSADHEVLGVIDPVAENVDGAGGVEGGGIGTRVTIEDASGAALVDFIVGKSVKDGDGLRYVRIPGRDRVYSVKVDTSNLTTRFEAWIEDDLLQLTPLDIREIVINDYTIDEINQRLLQGDVMKLSYDEQSSAWSMEGLAENEGLVTAKVNELKSAIDGLKIIDVHRKPTGLSAELRADDALELDAQSVRSLSQRGFYIAQNSLVSNQGELLVHMKDGVSYVLRFGEIARADRVGGELGEPEEGPAETTDGAARYLFIAAQFNAGVVAEPEYGELPELQVGAEEMTPPDEGDEAAKKAYDEAQSIKTLARIELENEELREDHEQKLAAGRQRVAELNDRFADWYYVISDSVYRKLRLNRPDLVEVAAGEDAGN